jgi:hypothetical protein
MKLNKIGLKFSLLTGSLMLASAVNAVGISQQDNNIVFGELEQQRYQLKVKMPTGELKSFIIANGHFALTPEMLGLKSLNNGQYKYELTPVFIADKLATDVRALNDDTVTADYAKAFKNHSESFSGFFTISQNSLITPEPEAAFAQPKNGKPTDSDDPIVRDQVILDDLIVDGSACIGFDCVNGESFGFDTLRLKENNLRLHFQDTSSSASFPTNDWRIVANDSSNGGGSYLGFEDSDAGRIPFRVEAGAPSNALYVESDGDIGIQTSNPVTNIHVVDGNTPTLRLEQNGSSGFTPQTWDIAGNEANFFVRDATNGSTLPFRIEPGSPSNALYIDSSTGDIGLGTNAPGENLHIISDSTTDGVGIKLEDTNSITTDTFRIQLKNNEFRLAFQNGGSSDLVIKNGIGIEADLDITAPVFHGDLDGAVISDRNKKMSFSKIDIGGILDKVGSLDITQWVYKDKANIKHIGPMAQDFNKAFGIGKTDKSIPLVDYLGISLASIKAIYIKLAEKDDKLKKLQFENIELKERLEKIENKLFSN